MSENYTVNYNINVNANAATQALTSFQTATNNLTKASNNLKNFEKQIQKTLGAFSKLSKKAPKIDFSTYDAKRKLNDIIRKLERINTLASKKRTIIINSKVQAQTTGTGTTQRGRTGTATTGRSVARSSSGSMSYKVLGPAMIDTGGIGAIDMLKGMGIAYGITGLGTLLSNAIKDASNYDNLMQTTRNILETHDKDKASFAGRFSSMEHLARYIGISTKYTAPEVADMTKFLAMAGMDINAINHAMNPIANVALIGDTELGKTADLVTNIMTGYGIKPENVGRATDIMAMTFTSANTTLTEIAEAYKYSASLLAAADVSFEEATAALGILGNAGIKGSQGGTSLRTILANVVNPRSKKREAAWDEIGVKRFNADGSMRSLTDIFQELHDKNLGPEMYYKLFDRTAAQGAVSLAANIQEWNNIIDRNFLSDGVAQSLADKKKNTIQGLWYQMTSTFTEQAMKVFEDMESPIRKFLVDIRKWIQTDDFKKSLKSVSETLMDLLGVILKFTKICIDLYNRFSFFVKKWIEWQLYLSASIGVLRTFKSVFNIGQFVLHGAKSIGVLTAQFGRLFSVLNSGAGIKHRMNSIWQSILPVNNMPLPHTTGVSRKAEIRYQRIYGKYANQSLFAGIGAGIGAGFGGYLGSQIGEAGSAGNMAATIGFGALGTIAGSMIPKAVAALASLAGISTAAMTGWLALVGAIGFGVYKWVKWREEVEKCTTAHNEFLASCFGMRGTNYTENATKADKYLTVIHNKQLSVNQLVDKHIQLIQEQLGIMDIASKQEKTFGETHKSAIDELNKPYLTQMHNTDKLWERVSMPIYFEDGTINDAFNVLLNTGKNERGVVATSALFNGIKFAFPSQVDVARHMFGMGRDTSVGTTLGNKREETNRRLLNAKSVADFDAIINDVIGWGDALPIAQGSETWFPNDLKDAKNWEQNYHYVTSMRQGLREQFIGDTDNALKVNAWREILNLYSTGQKVPNELLYKFLKLSGVELFDERFGPFGSDEMMKKWGWNGTDWTEISYGTGKFDENGEEIMRHLSSTESQTAFLEFLQQISSIVNAMQPGIRNVFSGILNHPVWGYGSKSDSKIVTYNGVDYILKEDGMYHPLHGSGEPMSKIEMAEATANQNTGNGSSTTSGTPDPKDYQNHYSSNSAAPKQVIVRIGNLMNVESIDMTNPNNAAVINDIKGQLAQALIDVVHDFDATWNA